MWEGFQLQLMDYLRKSNYNCIHLQHLLVEAKAKRAWEQNQLLILFKSWDKKDVFCLACPSLQDFLYEIGNFKLICSHFAAQVRKEENFLGWRTNLSLRWTASSRMESHSKGLWFLGKSSRFIKQDYKEQLLAPLLHKLTPPIFPADAYDYYTGLEMPL